MLALSVCVMTASIIPAPMLVIRLLEIDGVDDEFPISVARWQLSRFFIKFYR
jgi:hypothetical protein